MDNTNINSSAYTETSEMTDHVKITMRNEMAMVVELYPDKAPITVENFKKLVSDGTYNGLIFHRVIEGFMIQGGDPTGTGYGDGSIPTIKGEFIINGVNNPISHERGVISMARSNSYNSASSQFFIVHRDSKFLDGQYAAFGKLIDGYATLDAIAAVRTGSMDRPVFDQTIESATFVKVNK